MKNFYYLLMIAAFFLSCKKERVSSISPIKQQVPAVLTAAKYDTIPDASCFKIRLQQDSSTLDETSVMFKHLASIAYNDQEDARYFQGMGKANLSSLTSDGVPCAIQTTPYSAGMTIRLDATFRSSGTYLLKLSFLKMPPANQIWLHDNMKKDSLDLRTGNYQFEINTADTASYGGTRFKVILR